jgi:hypothetical protein
MRDNINPKHYQKGNIETIDYILAATQNLPGKEAVLVGNAIKYLSRFRDKNPATPKEDIKKAKWFVDKLLGLLAEENIAKGHPINALTAMGISKLSAPGRYADGNSLYLVVDKSGAKRWVLRTVVQGRRRDMGLGGIRTVSLAQARATAQRYRAIARNGGDPLEERRRETVPTTEKVSEDYKKGASGD